MSVTIEEVRERRRAAEDQLVDLLREFEQATGCSVREISIERVETTTVASERRETHLSTARLEVEIE